MLTGGNRQNRESIIRPKLPPGNPAQNPNGTPPPRTILPESSGKHPNRPGGTRTNGRGRTIQIVANAGPIGPRMCHMAQLKHSPAYIEAKRIMRNI